jgi:AraC family transcriptional regulator
MCASLGDAAASRAASSFTRRPARSSELRGWTALQARRAYLESANADDVAELTIDSAALMLTAALARESWGGQRWMPIVRDYLHAHFRQRLSLKEIAAAAGIHPVHLSRAFPSRHGLTLGEYVRALRVDYAARALMTTRRPIAEIAFDAGFASQAHLTRHFRIRMGVAPAAYRALCVHLAKATESF